MEEYKGEKAIQNTFIANMPKIKQTNQIKLILSSPDLAFNDLRWLVGMLNWKAHYIRNKKLIDYALSAKEVKQLLQN